MFKFIDKRIKFIIGSCFLLGSIYAGFYGYTLKLEGLPYNHFWALSTLMVWGGIDWISKALDK